MFLSDDIILVHNLSFKNMKMITTIHQDIAFIVKDIMMYKLGLEESHLEDEALLQDQLGVDSHDIIELMIEIENKFCIHISQEEAEKLHTVASIILCVQRKM
jgi:acyl carrier protein